MGFVLIDLYCQRILVCIHWQGLNVYTSRNSNKVAQPMNSPIVTLRVPPYLYEWLNAKAKKEGEPRSKRALAALESAYASEMKRGKRKPA